MNRNTETKEMILSAFKKGYTPTAEELLKKLRQSSPNFSRATLYRNLSAYCENGKLKKISTVGQADRYELNTGCNYHLVCEVCGKPGKLRTDGWWMALCDDCYEKSRKGEEGNIMMK